MQTKNDTTKPKDSPQQGAGEGCSGATCSRLVFQRRWYDSHWKRWSEWVELDGCNLLKYGDTPEEWRSAAKAYIEMGATYEYRIIQREEVTVWGISYSANAVALAPPPQRPACEKDVPGG